VDGDQTGINPVYVATIEVLPRYHYPWVFRIDGDAWHARPLSPDNGR
jgi:hypothetical protein